MSQADHWLLQVSGLRCASCVNKLESGLQQQPQINKVGVNLSLNLLDLQWQDKGDAKALQTWVAELGFGLQQEQWQAELTQVRCAGCISKIEQRLSVLPGVLSAQVSPVNHQLQLDYLAGSLNLDQVRTELQQLGYPAAAQVEEESPAEPAKGQAFWPIGLGLLACLPLVVSMYADWFGLHWMLPNLWALLITTPVFLGLGWPFFVGAWRSLTHGQFTMDSLVAIGTGTAWSYSLIMTLLGEQDHLYFDAAAVIVVLIRLGKWLEDRARLASGQAIRALMALQPQQAWVMRDGSWQVLALAEVQLGDQLLVKAGERLPLDGLIIEGQSELDESMLTGEPHLQLRGPGDTVYAGTLNQLGNLQICASSSASDSRLQHILRLVQQAQMSKPRIQALINRITQYFVPGVLLLAAVSFLGHWLFNDLNTAIYASVAVLVIACPCALGLATPTAIVAASTAGARMGILVRDMAQLESLAKVDTLVFDKTGTLTQGQPQVMHSFRPAKASSPTATGNNSTSLQLALAIGKQSDHPLAKAVANWAEQQLASNEADDDSSAHHDTMNHELLQLSTELQQAEAVIGKGVQAMTATGQRVRLGRASWLIELGIELPRLPDEFADLSQSWLCLEQQPLLAFGLSDPLRPEAKATVAQLQGQGLECWLLSGDQQAAVAKQAEQLGIKHYLAELLPQHKQQAVSQLQAKGAKVLMVGDGINDAPALAQADAGMAMGSGTQAALESAGISLMRPNLALIPWARVLARKLQSKIRQNLFWAFIFNVIGLPIAALGLLNPVYAGAAMALSSISVVSSSLLLLYWRPKLDS